MQLLELLGAGIAVIGTAIVAYTDYKTGYMPDMYTHSMIILGALLLPFYYPSLGASLWGYGTALAVFALCFVFYIFGQLGGGDVKLFTALTLLIPSYPMALSGLGFSPIAPPYPFIVSVFFASAVLAMFFVSGNYALHLYRDRGKVPRFAAKALRGIAYAGAVAVLVWLWSILSVRMLVFGVPMVLGAFVIAFKEDIMRLYVVKKKKVSRLNDDDVLALELMSASVKNKLGVGSRKTFLTMELKDLKKRARAAGISEVLVSEYLPKFGPYILAALLLDLLIGDALLWLLIS